MRHTRIIVAHYGGPDELRVIEEECPEPKDGEVRVRVLAAGVSLPDLLMREGVHPETRPVPFTPGWERPEPVHVTVAMEERRPECQVDARAGQCEENGPGPRAARPGRSGLGRRDGHPPRG